MVTPKRAEATCLIALRRQSPLASRSKRASSSPPSPVLDFPPMRFIAIASVSCASLLMDPNDIAPVAKRFTISLAGSTSSIGTGLSASLNSISPRSVHSSRLWLIDQRRVFLERLRSSPAARRAAACSPSADSADDTRRARDIDSFRRRPARYRLPTAAANA